MSTKDQMLQNILQVQYSHAEEYCDAQIRLGNILVTRGAGGDGGGGGSSIGQHKKKTNPLLAEDEEEDEFSQEELIAIMMQVQDSLAQIKRDWKSLRQLLITRNDDEEEEADDLQRVRVVVSLLRDHIALSRRVLQTVHDPYHSNGIPAVTTRTTTSILDSSQTKMVALATLRASTSRILEALR